VSVQDSQAGLWKGLADTITGKQRWGTLKGDFEFGAGPVRRGTCGASFSFSDQQAFCGLQSKAFRPTPPPAT